MLGSPTPGWVDVEVGVWPKVDRPAIVENVLLVGRSSETFGKL